jgi:hypothetical protein
MSDHTANLAAQPNSSLKAPSVASASCRKRNGECSMPFFDGAYSTPRRAAVWASFRRRDAEDDFAASGSFPPRIPSSTRGHASGLSAALRQARSSASASPPSGLRFPSTTDPPQMQSFGLGRRGLSLGFA